MRFLYLHGFASGPDSSKGVQLGRWFDAQGLSLERLNLRVPSMTYLRHSAMIEGVCETLGDDPGVLIGSSLGGLTALRVAARCPNVLGLVLLAPAIGLASRWRARLPIAVAQWQARGWMRVEDHAYGGLVDVDYGFLTDIEATDAVMPQVQVPTFIVHGTDDDVVPISASEEWAEGRANARLTRVRDGHQLAGSGAQIVAAVEAVLGAVSGQKG